MRKSLLWACEGEGGGYAYEAHDLVDDACGAGCGEHSVLCVRFRGAQTAHGQGTKTSNQDGLDSELQLQACPHHHQAWDEGQMDQQGLRCAHRNGQQREIVQLRTFVSNLETEIYTHLQECGE